MERHDGQVHMGRSRVHFNPYDNEEAEPVVNIARFDAESTKEDEARSSFGSVREDTDGQSRDITEAEKATTTFYVQNGDSDEEKIGSAQDTEHIQRMLNSKSSSAPSSPQCTPVSSPSVLPDYRNSDIPLLNLNNTPQTHRESHPSSVKTYVEKSSKGKRGSVESIDPGKKEADRLVKTHTKRGTNPKEFFQRMSTGDGRGLRSGQITPEEDGLTKHYTFNSGVLTNLLKLYNEQPQSSGNTPPSRSGRSTPKWYAKSPNNSTTSLSALLASSTRAAALPGLAVTDSGSMYPSHERGRSLAAALKPFHHKSKLDEQVRLTANKIADVLQRQRFILYFYLQSNLQKESMSGVNVVWESSS
jgi:hypothetical protein